MATEPPQPTLVESVLIEGSLVRILDRRVFPFERVWVECRTYEEVARAIEEMVTQSAGPYFAAAGGMVLAAADAQRAADGHGRREVLKQAADRLVSTRPTNNNIASVVRLLLAAGEKACASGDDVEKAVRASWDVEYRLYRDRSRALGAHMAEHLSDGEAFLTHCWAETGLIEAVRQALAQGKSLRAFCTETRPYLQGARLTAETLSEMGVDTTVITDGMAADVMSKGLVTKYVTAADRVTMGGHVVNKVGTLQIALAAHHFGVPFYVLVHAPDRSVTSPHQIVIEERDGDAVLSCLGKRTASYKVRGYYPLFDVTPPQLVHAIVTPQGVFEPARVGEHYRSSEPIHDHQ
jgi:methylthioribose-1-phosphate isomerase